MEDGPSSASPHSPAGVVIIDKPSGPTSFRVVAQARRLYATRRVGHCGTLDPMASGVLVLVLGEATKLSSALTGADKGYLASIRFGSATDSLDADGHVVESRQLPPGWSRSAPLETALEAEASRQSQIPPQFSAIKLQGRPAYERARRGQHLELEERPVRVRQLRVEHFDDERLDLRLDVSKGYYVRSLARDLSERLGVPGHLAALRRTRSGCFSLEDACEWPTSAPPPTLSLGEAARRALHCATLTPEGEVRARQGKPLGSKHFTPPIGETDPGLSTEFAWLSAAGELVAIGEHHQGDEFRVRRGFVAPR